MARLDETLLATLKADPIREHFGAIRIGAMRRTDSLPVCLIHQILKHSQRGKRETWLMQVSIFGTNRRGVMKLSHRIGDVLTRTGLKIADMTPPRSWADRKPDENGEVVWHVMREFAMTITWELA